MKLKFILHIMWHMSTVQARAKHLDHQRQVWRPCKERKSPNDGLLGCSLQRWASCNHDSDAWLIAWQRARNKFLPREPFNVFFLAGYWTPIRWICRWGEWVFRLSGKWCCLFCFDFCQYVRLPKIGTLFRIVLLLPQLLWNAALQRRCRIYLLALCHHHCKETWSGTFSPKFSSTSARLTTLFFSIELGDKQLFQNIVTLSYD